MKIKGLFSWQIDSIALKGFEGYRNKHEIATTLQDTAKILKFGIVVFSSCIEGWFAKVIFNWIELNF